MKKQKAHYQYILHSCVVLIAIVPHVRTESLSCSESSISFAFPPLLQGEEIIYLHKRAAAWKFLCGSSGTRPPTRN